MFAIVATDNRTGQEWWLTGSRPNLGSEVDRWTFDSDFGLFAWLQVIEANYDVSNTRIVKV